LSRQERGQPWICALTRRRRRAGIGVEVALSVLRRTYTIESWRTWDDAIDRFARNFKSAFGLYPNLLLGSSSTLAHIDMAAKRDKLTDPDGRRPEDGVYAAIGVFSGDGYALDFCINERVPSKAVSLVFDSDPEGGGEPLPDLDRRGRRLRSLLRA
jgi:hypothetical protein